MSNQTANRGSVTLDLPGRDRTRLRYSNFGAGRTTSDHQLDRPLVGIGFCALGLMMFACQDVIIKLMSASFSIWQLAFVRAVVVLGIMIPIMLMTAGIGGFRTKHLGKQLLRGTLAVTSYTSYYVAVSKMALVDAGALMASAPLFVTAFSSLLLGEKVGIRRWSAVAVGFFGVLVMLRPGVGVFQPVALLAVCSAAVYAYSTTVTRKLGATDSALAITIYSNLVYLVVSSVLIIAVGVLPLSEEFRSSSPFILTEWQVPDARAWTFMVTSGLLAGVGFFSLSQAYRVAPVSAVAPIEFSYLIWALLLGFLVFADLPSFTTCVGAALVISAGIYIIRREATLLRKLES